MTDSLIIKDGAGSLKNLTVESGSYGYIPVHAISSSAGSGSYITASANYPVYVTGNVSISQPISVTASFAPVTTVSQVSVTSFDWSTSASGTFQIAASDAARKGLSIFNPGSNPLYVVLSTAGGTKNGFTLVNTSSAPSDYSLILYSSGTYVADSTNVSVAYGGYFISGSASSGIYITKIS